MKRSIALALSLVALTAFFGLGYVAVSVATEGTGASVPAGDGVIEGRVAGQLLVPSPAGEPFLYGDVRIVKPGGTQAVDHGWHSPAGNPEVVVRGLGGSEHRVTLPAAPQWKGSPQVDQREVDDLEGLPIVGDVDDASQQMPPPYLVVVRAIRPGDTVIARVAGDNASELWIGERAQLEAALAQQEAMRWPIVGLLGIMSLVSLALAFVAFRRSRAQGAQSE